MLVKYEIPSTGATGEVEVDPVWKKVRTKTGFKFKWCFPTAKAKAKIKKEHGDAPIKILK